MLQVQGVGMKELAAQLKNKDTCGAFSLLLLSNCVCLMPLQVQDVAMKELAAQLKDSNSLLFFARGNNYATALEAALKVGNGAGQHYLSITILLCQRRSLLGWCVRAGYDTGGCTEHAAQGVL